MKIAMVQELGRKVRLAGRLVPDAAGELLRWGLAMALPLEHQAQLHGQGVAT